MKRVGPETIQTTPRIEIGKNVAHKISLVYNHTLAQKCVCVYEIYVVAIHLAGEKTHTKLLLLI